MYIDFKSTNESKLSKSPHNGLKSHLAILAVHESSYMLWTPQLRALSITKSCSYLNSASNYYIDTSHSYFFIP